MAPGLLLVIDVGNTQTVLGLYRGTALRAAWRVATVRQRTADELSVFLRSLMEAKGLDVGAVAAVAVSNVVPPLERAIDEMVAGTFGVAPVWVGRGAETGMPILCDNPSEVGADRIVNGVAAFRKYGGPCIVVDFGTATTFDAVSARGEYLGGAIAPGLQISSEALFERAARLPRVALQRPPHIIGKNTVESMQVGLLWGYVGLTEGLITRMKAELPGARVIATGGLASVVARETSLIDVVDDDLTLEGLRLIYQRNAASRGPRSRAGRRRRAARRR